MDVLVNGLVFGCVYAFVALGFTFTWTTTRTLNFAQGELLMLGALTGVTLHVHLGVPLLPTVLLAALVSAAASVIIYWGAVAPFNRGHEAVGWILATVGVAIALRAAAAMIWGKSVIPFPSFFGDDLIELGPFVVETQQIVIVVGLFIIVGFLHLFVNATLWGRALTAVAQNRMAASLSGISPAVVASAAFAISGALAGLAGLLIAPVTFASANMGAPLLVKAFTVSVLAGLSSLWGAIVCGLLFGVVEAMVARYVGSEFRDIFGLLILALVLAFRPSGLFGLRQVVKV